MRKPLVALVVLLLPTALLAATKDVTVTNTVDVDVKSLPDNSVELGTGYRIYPLSCLITPQTSSSCYDGQFPNPTSEKDIHWASISVLADPGYVCRATVSIFDDTGGGSAGRNLLRVYATGSSPGQASIAFPRPIRIEDVDGISLSLQEINFQNTGCRAEASVGFEVVTP